MRAESNQQSEELDDINHLESVIEWYKRHTSDMGFTSLKFSILTANDELLKVAPSKPHLSITSLLELLYKTNSNLLDFMGF
jgi:hypothetical protein